MKYREVMGWYSQVQEAGLRSSPDIIVATPGRMIDHLHNTQSVGLEELAILVLDEADRLLEMGFSKEVDELVCWILYHVIEECGEVLAVCWDGSECFQMSVNKIFLLFL